MKKLNLFLLSIAALGSVITSCDKVEMPYPNAGNTTIDTTLYPGNYTDYLASEYPTFSTNTNSLRNALIEDYTGHTCFNCPDAAVVAEDLHELNPDRVFVATIHTGPGNLGFQSVSSGSSFTTDHTCEEGIEYGNFFASGFGFTGNPSGNVSRTPAGSQMFSLDSQWGSRTNAVLADSDLKVNIQSDFNYFTETGGGFLHVETEKLTSDALDLSLTVYVIEDTLVDWQIMPDNTANENYVHRERLIETIDGLAWGQQVLSSSDPVGTKVIKDYSYKIPTGLNYENMHLLIYVYDQETKEVYQVIKQKFKD